MTEHDSDVAGTATIRETIAQVRFALSQLAARNGHHEFEEMTRALARETISRNILPATGPVAAGGDQGRDFETFTSYLAGQVGKVGTEIGVSEGDGLAFACTLQADDIKSKTLLDVEKIVKQGSPVEHVIYYCEANVPVGRRHELQEVVRHEYAIHIEIFDGTAIAELLSQRHLFSIAQTFLHLPAAALPPTPERPDWYESDLERWRANERIPTTPGDLVDLSGCIRFATFNEEAARDLPFWIERLGALLRDEVPISIQQRARYEIAVAQLRGLGDLRPAEELVRAHVDGALGSDDPAELSDTSVLLMYCVGAKGRELTEFSENMILSWNRELQERVSGLLGTTDLPGRRCALLETLGWLRAQPDLVAAKEGGFEYRLDEQIPRLSLDEIENIARRGLVEPILVPLVDLEGAFDSWVEMVELLPGAPLFPVERIGRMLRLYAHILIEDFRYDVVVSAIDARIAEVVGGDAAASNARDRAMMFYERSRLLDALREIHRARMGWLAGETSKDLVLAMLMISQIYRELELPMAAKYSAMAAARLVGDDHKDFYARACFKAAEADYHQGAWFSSVQIADLGLRAHLLLAEDPHNLKRYKHLQYVFFELSVIRGTARAADADYEEFVEDVLGQTKLDEFLDDMLHDGGVTPWWTSLTVQELGERAAEDLGHRAFSDGGQRRSVSWTALGVEWVVRFDNAYEETLVGERLAAFAQITMSELATHDLALLPTRVAFDVKSAPPENDLTIQSHSDGRGTQWQVQLPRVEGNTADSIRKAGQETLTVVTAAIADVSVLPQSELMESFDSVFAAGLHDKLSFGTIYDVALGDLVGPETFKQAPRRENSPIPAEISPIPRQARSLEFTGKGPHYDTNKSVNLAEGRYTNISNTLVATLPALTGHQAFLDVVERLRSDGWKDWHILTAVMNVAQNDRLQLRQPPRSDQEARQYFEAFTATENPDDPAPLALFSEEALRQAIRISMPSTLKVWKLELRQNPPDMSALEELLANRYGYWTDDAPHKDIFRSEESAT